MDRSTALDRVRSLAHTGYGVGKVVAGQLGRAAVGVSKAAVAVGHDVVERRKSARGPAPHATVPSPRTPPPATSTPEPSVAVPADDESAAVTSDVDAEVQDAPPNPADVARVVQKKPRSARPAPAAASSRKRPAKKSVPGARLPPRRQE